MIKRKNFSPEWYLKNNPDVAASGMDPWVHYQQFGAAEGRRPAPFSFFERLSIRVKVVLSTIKSVYKREGGIIPIVRLTIKTLSNSGFVGLKIKIANHHYTSTKLYKQHSYLDWTINAEKISEIESSLHKQFLANIKNTPIISLIMATYNTPEEFLHKIITSVMAQSYSNWELCIADDCSSLPHVKRILLSYLARDSRIKVFFREKNGHISEATNSAIGLSKGTYLAFIDHDDELHKDALLYVANTIVKNPDAALIYTDEDKINTHGVRSEPHFKSDFNYELMLTYNMICHLTVIKKVLVEQVGFLRTEFNGAQDYDLCLRVIEKIDFGQVIHIPKVLYHWRQHTASTAADIAAKPYALLASQKAVQDHLNRLSIAAEVEAHPIVSFWNKVNFALPTSLPSVEIIIPTRDRIELMQVCINSILKKTTYPNYRITIVDNGSVEDDSLSQFAIWSKNSKITVIRDDSPFNYSQLNNKAAFASECEFICLLNNDIKILTSNWLEEMISLAQREDVGCVGARLWYPDDRLQHGGVILGIGGIAGHSHKYLAKGEVGYFGRAVCTQTLSCVTAAALVIRTSIYKSVGGLDEKIQVAFNDVDFCLRVIEAGYRNVWTPFAEMYHYESATRGHEDNPEKVKRFNSEVDYMKQRWGTKLLKDPYYSPNLTLEREDFSYAELPRSSEFGV